MRRIRSRVLGVLAAFGLAFGLMSPASAAPSEPAPLSTDTPVVFVHGYTGSASNWTAAKTVFRANGWSSDDLFAYEYDSYGNNVNNAQGLASFVDNVKSGTGADQVAIVNHSMGGLVSQYYLKVLGGHRDVSHLASIAGANHGTTFASACLIYPTCQQMYPGSSFIDEITAGDETPGATEYATWYSACDGIILPYTSTRLDGADNNNVACQTHLGFLADTSVLREIARFVA
ncbi:Extracellular esterase EstB precursor [Streptomyces sp. YIM 130001]|uniref:esterase/lipase family protein n=1 Tax=Streptomyces sp. YIM 130001 TaxID=2259644 RepID=UPI000EC03763|nr:alpha/beta fold hydrolase [Streptomyces sp. YIM 130001]RII15751.1 Extracellular esterase EstB precursor [Streptomyces sp. YIM 130001]